VMHPVPVGGGGAARAVSFALAQVGKPYRWGTAGPGSYDCSGLTLAAYRYAGIAIPRVSMAQWSAGPHVAIPALRPGDLMFYGYDPGNPDSIHHVAIYVGRGLVVEAPYTGANLRLNSYQRGDYVGATRPTG
jgi:cell wall-associated NlpC family hydrolase